jgi:nucleotide-binding universal stress UspA family protein
MIVFRPRHGRVCRQCHLKDVAMGFKKVLIAIDSEPVAVRAAETGVNLAQALGAEVAFINVVDSALAYPGDTGPPASELIAAAKLNAKRLVTTIRQRVSPQSSVLEFIQVGAPSEEIVKVAKEWSADLLVIGSHGRGGMQRALLGSVAETVMRHAPCPLVVVRSKE